MTIQTGQPLPEGTLSESPDFDPASGCPLKPQPFSVPEQAKGKRVVIFGVPGAFTPTCSAQHLPGYIAQREALSAQGVDEVWCMSVNDGFVMAAWGRERGASGTGRRVADGSADYARKLGLEMDLTAKGMGMRCQRFALVADDGVVTQVAVEEPGKFEVSNAEAVLARL